MIPTLIHQHTHGMVTETRKLRRVSLALTLGVMAVLPSCHRVSNHYSNLQHLCGQDTSTQKHYLHAPENTLALIDSAEADPKTYHNIPTTSQGCFELPAEQRQVLLRNQVANLGANLVIDGTQPGLTKAQLVADPQGFSNQNINFDCRDQVVRQEIEFKKIQTPSPSLHYYNYTYTLRDPDGLTLSKNTLNPHGQTIELPAFLQSEPQLFLTLEVVDLFNQENQAQTLARCEIFIDQTPPTIFLEFPSQLGWEAPEGTSIAFANQAITLFSEDPHLSWIRYCFQPEGSPDSCRSEGEFNRLDGPLKVPAQGSWQLHYYAEDIAGNRSSTEVQKVVVFHEELLKLKENVTQGEMLRFNQEAFPLGLLGLENLELYLKLTEETERSQVPKAFFSQILTTGVQLRELSQTPLTSTPFKTSYGHQSFVATSPSQLLVQDYEANAQHILEGKFLDSILLSSGELLTLEKGGLFKAWQGQTAIQELNLDQEYRKIIKWNDRGAIVASQKEFQILKNNDGWNLETQAHSIPSSDADSGQMRRQFVMDPEGLALVTFAGNLISYYHDLEGTMQRKDLLLPAPCFVTDAAFLDSTHLLVATPPGDTSNDCLVQSWQPLQSDQSEAFSAGFLPPLRRAYDIQLSPPESSPPWILIGDQQHNLMGVHRSETTSIIFAQILGHGLFDRNLLKFSSQGEILAGIFDQNIHIWRQGFPEADRITEDGLTEATAHKEVLDIKEQKVLDMSISHDHQEIAIAGYSEFVRKFSTTETLFPSYLIPMGQQVYSVDSKSKKLATISRDRQQVQVRDMITQKTLEIWPLLNITHMTHAFSGRLVLANQEGQLWARDGQGTWQTITEALGPVTQLLPIDDNKLAIASRGSIIFVEHEGDHRYATKNIAEPQPRETRLYLSPDGRWLAGIPIASPKSIMTLVHIQSTQTSTIAVAQATGKVTPFSSNGQWLVNLSQDKKIEVRNLAGDRPSSAESLVIPQNNLHTVFFDQQTDDLFLIQDLGGRLALQKRQISLAPFAFTQDSGTDLVDFSDKGVAIESSQDYLFLSYGDTIMILKGDELYANIQGASKDGTLGPLSFIEDQQILLAPYEKMGRVFAIPFDPKAMRDHFCSWFGPHLKWNGDACQL